MYHIGDRVIYIGDPRKLTGKVVDIIYDQWLGTTQCKVEFDDKSLAPHQMIIPVIELERYKSPHTVAGVDPSCDCGLKYCRDGGDHSDWCITRSWMRR